MSQKLNPSQCKFTKACGSECIKERCCFFVIQNEDPEGHDVYCSDCPRQSICYGEYLPRIDEIISELKSRIPIWEQQKNHYASRAPKSLDLLADKKMYFIPKIELNSSIQAREMVNCAKSVFTKLNCPPVVLMSLLRYFDQGKKRGGAGLIKVREKPSELRKNYGMDGCSLIASFTMQNLQCFRFARDVRSHPEKVLKYLDPFEILIGMDLELYGYEPAWAQALALGQAYEVTKFLLLHTQKKIIPLFFQIQGFKEVQIAWLNQFSFIGWNYAVLSHLGKTDSKFLSELKELETTFFGIEDSIRQTLNLSKDRPVSIVLGKTERFPERVHFHTSRYWYTRKNPGKSERKLIDLSMNIYNQYAFRTKEHFRQKALFEKLKEEREKKENL